MNPLARVTFFMEQHLGHRTYYQNLRRSITAQPCISPRWVEVTYEQPSQIYDRLPFLPHQLKGPLAGRAQVLQGLSSEDFDVAFFNTQAPAALAFEQVKKKPYVLCSDITPIQYDAFAAEYNHAVDRLKLVRNFKHSVNTRLFQSAAYLFPWSNWVRDSFIADYGVDPEKAIVIPPGIDVDLWKPRKRKDGSGFRILFVGGDFYRKGGPFLLDVYHKLRREPCELVIVTRSQVPTQEGITIYQNMSPNSPELIALYQSCDVFIFPTQAEAFGIAAIEAAAAGLPVIASRVGGLNDIVIPEKTGFLFEKNDLASFVDAIHLLMEKAELRTQMGQAAREHAETNFDASKNAALIQNLLIHASQY